MIVELSLPVVLAVAAGGGLGAVARYLLDTYLPGGLLIANTAGSLLLGVMLGVAAAGGAGWHPLVLGLCAAGFFGALTTFATLALRAAQLWVAGERISAAGLWLVHVGAGLPAAALGAWLGWMVG